MERSSRRKVTHTWSKKRPRTPYVLVGEAIATTVRPHLTLVRTPPWRMEGAQPRQSAHARPCLKHLLLLLTAVAPGKKKGEKEIEAETTNRNKKKGKETLPGLRCGETATHRANKDSGHDLERKKRLAGYMPVCLPFVNARSTRAFRLRAREK